MTTITFDTYQFVKSLEDRGFSREQAEGINDALKNALTVAEVATKRDLTEMEYRLTIKIGALIVSGIGIVTAIAKLI
jgi:hypothetical protein